MDDQEIKVQNDAGETTTVPAPRANHTAIKILVVIILVCACGFLIFSYFKNKKSPTAYQNKTSTPPASLETVQATLSPHQKLQIAAPGNLSSVAITSLPQELQSLVSVDATAVSAQQGAVGTKQYYQINYSVQGVELSALHLSLLDLFKKNWTYVYAERSTIYAFIEEQDQNYQVRATESIADRSQLQNINVVLEILAK